MLNIDTAAAPIVQIDAGGLNIGGIIIGLIGLIGVVYTARSSYRAAKAQAQAETEAAADTHELLGFDQKMSLTKYIREEISREVDRQTKGIRAELHEMREQFGAVRTKLARMGSGFRDFIRATYETWPDSTVEPPKISAHIRDLLTEDDLEGTFTRAEVAEKVATDKAVADSTDH